MPSPISVELAMGWFTTQLPVDAVSLTWPIRTSVVLCLVTVPVAEPNRSFATWTPAVPPLTVMMTSPTAHAG